MVNKKQELLESWNEEILPEEETNLISMSEVEIFVVAVDATLQLDVGNLDNKLMVLKTTGVLIPIYGWAQHDNNTTI